MSHHSVMSHHSLLTLTLSAVHSKFCNLTQTVPNTAVFNTIFTTPQNSMARHEITRVTESCGPY